jgi:hypothetical protein
LRDDERVAARVRRQLRGTIKSRAARSLKELLSAAPLEGVRIVRSRERAGSVAL